ncbi:MAG TPA: papain-like cysteine protease family protein [Thermoanaerobaculia bacterium]|nr:papain-like cysteine protease family protein [Thermoanaerobaculia bacterium]
MSIRAMQRWLLDSAALTTTALPVPFYLQQQSLWCWAACVDMAVVYYNTAAVQQCEIVNYTLARTDCCSNPGSGWCNTSIPGAWFAGIYNHYGIANCVPSAAPATFTQVQAAIAANRLLAAGLSWTAGGSHVTLVTGFSTDGGSFVLVNDPGFGGSMWVTYAGLLYGYGLGNWVETWTMWV